MKKLSIYAVALAAMALTACGGNKSAQTAEEAQDTKSFEQEQIEMLVKADLDRLAASIARLPKLTIVQEGENGIQLTEQEKQVKPDYLLDPSTTSADAATLAEQYRTLSALSVDKQIAALYGMPTDSYESAIAKLMADTGDPSFKVLDNAGDVHQTGEALYNAMNENGRINSFWQMVATSLIEELYVMTQNTDKFLTVFTDESAANITGRLVLLTDAVRCRCE